jgi:hypothetical protein
MSHDRYLGQCGVISWSMPERYSPIPLGLPIPNSLLIPTVGYVRQLIETAH